MIRFAWLTTACAVLLTACGGGVSSPDFQGQLVGVGIVHPGSTTTGSSDARVAPGTTVQFQAVGLYSTPPGTAGGVGLVPCAPNSTDLCRQGSISGVTWSVDASGTGTTGPVATISASGLLTGARRGLATVRARVANLEDATQRVIVNGAVLKSIAITSIDAKNNVAATSVPTGRSFILTGAATCESGFAGGSQPPPSAGSPDTDPDEYKATDDCTNLDYQFSWALPATTEAGTVEFTPTSQTGESISVKTKRFGPFQIIARFVNEEGIAKEQTVSLNATERVLDDVVVAADPVQAAPVPVLIGTKTRFVARGLFSDGAIDVIRAADLREGTTLTWSQDTAAVGQIVIENATGPSPNSAVLVSGDEVGVTGLTVKGNNIENVPSVSGGPITGLPLEDRISVDVKTLGLLGLVDICPFDSVGTACLQNPQLPLGSTIKFKARGNFSDNPSVARDIDPARIGLTWDKTVTPQSGDVTVVTTGTAPNLVTTGEFTATKLGPVTLNVSITDPLVEPAATPRQLSANATVIESLCTDQLLSSNGTSTTVSSNEVSNAGSAIDSDPNSFATITLNQSFLLGTEQSLSLQRAATTVTPAVSGTPVGFLIAHEDVFNPDTLVDIATLNAAGAVVQDNLSVTATRLTGVPQRNAETLVSVKVNATQPFTGLRLTLTPPDPESPVPIPVLGELLALLLGGGETDVHVYAACSGLGG